MNHDCSSQGILDGQPLYTESCFFSVDVYICTIHCGSVKVEEGINSYVV